MTQALALRSQPAARAVAVASLVAWMAAAAGVLGVDTVVAGGTAATWVIEAPLDAIVGWLDFVALKEVSNFLFGSLLLVVAGAMLALKRHGGWTLLYVGVVQFLATTIADLAKPVFGRLRPYEAMPDGGGLDRWFAGGQSFPSGHVAFYASLFVPLMLLWPRYTLVWIIIPLLVAAQRLLAHDHYLSDVAASIGLATLLSVALAGTERTR
jgi:membrane-associated phospholipid phosphatase